MVGSVRPNDLGGLSPADPVSEMALVATGGDVRELQRRLWACAKRSPERRFHALYDRVCRGDVLREAWRRVRKNRGVAGVDALTLAAVEEYGVERLLGELQCALRQGSYRPAPVRRVAIVGLLAVVGAGHAGTAAAAPSAKIGHFTLGRMDSRGGNGSPSFQPWKTCWTSSFCTAVQ